MKQETNTNLIPSKEEIFSWIEHFCSFGHRRSGTENNWKSAQFIAEKFKEFGMEDVRFDHPDAKLNIPTMTARLAILIPERLRQNWYMWEMADQRILKAWT